MAIFGPATATAVTSSSAEIYTPTSGGLQQNVTIINTGPVTFYIGSFTAVTAVTGLKVAAGAQVTIEATEEAVYAITSSGSSSALTGLATVASVV